MKHACSVLCFRSTIDEHLAREAWGLRRGQCGFLATSGMVSRIRSASAIMFFRAASSSAIRCHALTIRWGWGIRKRPGVFHQRTFQTLPKILVVGQYDFHRLLVAMFFDPLALTDGHGVRFRC